MASPLPPNRRGILGNFYLSWETQRAKSSQIDTGDWVGQQNEPRIILQ